MIRFKSYLQKAIVAVAILFSTVGQAQSDGSEFVQRHDYSPEVQANNVVDYYTGKINTTIPIHTYKGRELDLPISVNYTTDGVQVEEIANNVGLGWNLNCGGRINAMINAEIDQTYSQASQYQRDIYALQLPGINEYFTMEYYSPRALLNPGIKADLRVGEGSDWIVHMPDGATYYFEGNSEITKTYKAGPNNSWANDQSYTSSYLLTKIVSKNGLDVYKFNYQNRTWDDAIPNNGEGYTTTWSTGAITPKAAYNMNQRQVISIFHNDEKIVGFNYGARSDLKIFSHTGNALLSIYFFNFKAGPNSTDLSGNIFKKAAFNYSYFGNVSSTNYLDKRLKLDNIQFYGFNGSTPVVGDKYEFVYESPQLVPPITSFAQDYLGLYNGKDSNINLVDDVYYHDSPVRRKFDIIKSQYGLLKKIIYPTKGYAEYEFEQNRLNDNFEYNYLPDSFRTDQIDVAMLNYNATENPSVGGSWLYCQATAGHGSELTSWHPSMQNVNFSNYGGTGGPYHMLNTFTTYLEVGNEGDFFINTPGNGYGIYLIQSLSGISCNSSNTNASCAYRPGNTAGPTACLRNTATILYTGTSPLPDGFVKGGLTNTYQTDDEMVHLVAGKYQITLWTYFLNNTSSPGSYLRLYKKIQTPVPAHLVSSDVPGILTDGFRIKAVKTYSANGVFAGRKEYKYNGGRLIHQVENYFDGKLSSQGYLYNDVVFYESVAEKETDLSGTNFNGYKQYVFSNIDDPTYEGTDSVIPQNGIHKSYGGGNSQGFTFEMQSIHNSDLKERKIFDKNGNLVLSEKNHYGLVPYLASVYNWSSGETGSPWVSESATFPYLVSNKITELPSLGNGISKTATYTYEDNEAFFLPASKEINYNDDYIESVYYSNAVIYGAYDIIVPSTVSYPNYDISYEYNTSSTSPSLPKSITKSDYDTRTELIYDSAKNLVTTIKYTPGTMTSASYEAYIYGYNNRFIVAKILGKKYSDLSTALIDNIQSASNVSISAANDNTLRTNLNALRTTYTDCQITTYTFNPSYGLTSETDEKGYTLYYEYDSFGRVQYTKEKDANGNMLILSENQYNTRQ